LTLCVTAIVVPLMSYVVMPFLFRRFDGWLRR
jgi:antibiotic biosynthesis monooxygenase (ABM) superfamily enzyme